MSSLQARLELTKLARRLNISTQQLAALSSQPADNLRLLRRQSTLSLFHREHAFFHHLATILAPLPTPLLAALATRFGPRVTAQLAVALPSAYAAGLAARLSSELLAQTCLHLDPLRSRELIRHLDLSTLVRAACQLVDKHAFIELGQLADFLDDDAIQAVIAAIDDDRALLSIAYYMESRTRLDHIVQLMPRQRLERIVMNAADPANDQICEILALLSSVGYSLRSPLSALAADQPAQTLTQIILLSDRYQLWPELLPILTALNPERQRRLLALPVLLEQPSLLSHAIEAADQHGLWSSVLPLVPLMNNELVQTVAEQAARLPDAAIERAMTAALMGEQWQALAQVAQRLPADKQMLVRSIIVGYGAVDAELSERLQRLLQAYEIAR